MTDHCTHLWQPVPIGSDGIVRREFLCRKCGDTVRYAHFCAASGPNSQHYWLCTSYPDIGEPCSDKKRYTENMNCRAHTVKHTEIHP